MQYSMWAFGGLLSMSYLAGGAGGGYLVVVVVVGSSKKRGRAM